MGGEQTASVGQISRTEAHFRQRSKTLTKHMQMQLDVSSSLIFPRPCPVYWWDQRHSSCCKCSGFLAFFSLILSENSHLSILPLLLLFSRSVMSYSWWPHGLQHARLPCPSPSPAVYSNSCPLSWWCHPTIWSSVHSAILTRWSPIKSTLSISALNTLIMTY